MGQDVHQPQPHRLVEAPPSQWALVTGDGSGPVARVGRAGSWAGRRQEADMPPAGDLTGLSCGAPVPQPGHL